ncbi:MAG TPA: hypothetical protein DCM87_14220 [Planctomycetes bacterium]|nr:hypothetical protein [Planctomycetota bacterium]
MADLSFDEVARELGIGAEELRRMVADNEIRAFHEGGELRFKREDVNKLRNRLETEPTIILSDTDAGRIIEDVPIELESSILEEPVLEEPALDAGLADDALQSSETVLSVDGLLEDSPASADETALGLDVGESADAGHDTVFDSQLVEDDLSLGDDSGALAIEEDVRSGPRRIKAKAQEADPVMTVLAVAACALMILPGAVLVNLAGGRDGSYPGWIGENLSFLNGIVDNIVQLF